MERELLMTGIGGQGVQLAAQVLARAATAEGRHVMFFGIYGGVMRGGNTDSTVVVADEPITAPPVVAQAWSAIAMHDDHWAGVAPRLAPGALVLVNDPTFAGEVPAGAEALRIDASGIAAGAGSPLGGSMAMLGAYCALTGIVARSSLVAAMRASLPSYRTQHAAANERAIAAGWEAVALGSRPAWPHAAVAAGER